MLPPCGAQRVGEFPMISGLFQGKQGLACQRIIKHSLTLDGPVQQRCRLISAQAAKNIADADPVRRASDDLNTVSSANFTSGMNRKIGPTPAVGEKPSWPVFVVHALSKGLARRARTCGFQNGAAHLPPFADQRFIRILPERHQVFAKKTVGKRLALFLRQCLSCFPGKSIYGLEKAAMMLPVALM